MSGYGIITVGGTSGPRVRSPSEGNPPQGRQLALGPQFRGDSWPKSNKFGGSLFGGTAGAMTAGYIMFEKLYNEIL